MSKRIICQDCKNVYRCEFTYLGGCTNGEEWEEPPPQSVYSDYARTVMRALSVVGVKTAPKNENSGEVDKSLKENKNGENKGK